MDPLTDDKPIVARNVFAVRMDTTVETGITVGDGKIVQNNEFPISSAITGGSFCRRKFQLVELGDGRARARAYRRPTKTAVFRQPARPSVRSGDFPLPRRGRESPRGSTATRQPVGRRRRRRCV